MTNGIKFCHIGCRVEISAKTIGSNIQISVRDNGIGIESENIERLFTMGSQFSSQGTAYEKGTGLGLILCKEYVLKHGGSIWVESKLGIGCNLLFTITLEQ